MKTEVLAEKRSTDPMIAAQVLLAQSLLGAASVSGAAQVNPILAGGGGIEDIINPVRAKLRAIAKQPKYNGNPRRWAVFKRQFSLWVGNNKLRDNEKLDALLECLEGPIRDTWIKSCTDSDAFPWGAWPRDAAVTRTSKQAGKALRSQGHQYARVM